MGPETRLRLDHLGPNVFRSSRWSSPHLSTRHNFGTFRQACYQLPPERVSFTSSRCRKRNRAPPKPFRGQRKICRERRNWRQPLSIDTRQQFGQHVARRRTLPENNGEGESQEPKWKLGDAAAVSLTYLLDA